MFDRVSPDVTAAIAADGRARVIVTFDHPCTDDELATFDVVFNLRSVNAAALRIDGDDLRRLEADACVVRIELDGEIRAFD